MAASNLARRYDPPAFVGLRLVVSSPPEAVAPLMPAELPAARERLVPPAGERLRDRLRFIFALIAVAVVGSGLVAAGLVNAREQEARATGGTSEPLVVEGIPVVLVDSAADLPAPVPPAPVPPSAAPTESVVRPDATAEPAPPLPVPDVAEPAEAAAEPAPPSAPVVEEPAPDPVVEKPGPAPPALVEDQADEVAPPVPAAVEIQPEAARVPRASPVVEPAPVAAPPPPQAKRPKAARPPRPADPHVASASDSAAKGPTAGKAGAGGTSTDERGVVLLSSYRARLAAHLRRFRAYPAEAGDRDLRGVATVTFTVRPDGGLAAARLAGSSGAAVLDSAALAMVRRAAPFPPIPAALAQAAVTVTAPIQFER